MKKIVLAAVIITVVSFGITGCSLADLDGNNTSTDKIEQNDNNINGTIENSNELQNSDVESNSESIDSENKILSLSLFIPNGNYEVTFAGSDLASTPQYIKGDGKSYQVIGVNGKGHYIDVYSLKDNGIYKIYTEELSEDQKNGFEGINYLNKDGNLEEEALLNGPIEVGTRWGNKEIVEVGENLVLNDITLEGTYIKTWEKDSDNVKICYYSEGLGCVKYKVLMEETEVEHSTLTAFEKK